MTRRRVLVTGAGGLIGVAVVRRLDALGWSVTGLERPGVTPPPECRPLLADVRDVAAVGDAMAGQDAVVHLAGVPGLGLDTPEETYSINTLGTFCVLRAAAEAGVRDLVFASSINASGIPLNVHPVYPEGFPYDESTPPDVADWYSLSKLENELTGAMVARRYGAKVIGLRFPLIRDFAEAPATHGRHIAALVEREPRRAACDGFSYLDVHDAAEAVARALDASDGEPGGVLVAAPTTYLTIDTEAALARCAPGVPCTGLQGREVALDLSRARRVLGEWPLRTLDEIAPGALYDPTWEVAA
ncbi:hypothetical protein GCM10025864_21820 [Luteimicrobium album]|uniref:NAD-dependent epimerase/dehydratase domain-containing protein n=1 Tax=Luteimicrobium album TaxID=1054550 RepID=A0ABQ6I2N5_9MICO|nr:NAD(P)-dependent oxidoreductase [Luteimicrobium album]GMA24423.1 hypothetical protein GCM10025864_21820 [Luteimicrobium album]